MSLIKVVHYSNTPVAGSPFFTSRALNDYTTIWSHTIQHKTGYGARTYPHGLLVRNNNLHMLAKVLEGADIVHCHNYLPTRVGLMKAARRKPLVVQHHQYPPSARLPTKLSDNVREAIIAQPAWVREYEQKQPDMEYVLLPNIIPIYDDRFCPHGWSARRVFMAPEPHKKMHVAYAPSARNLGGLHDKGFDGTMRVLEKLAGKGVLTYDLIEKTPLWETLERKRLAHVVIDEVVTGNFHRASLESLSQGACVIANINDYARQFLRHYLDIDDDQIPWVSTDMAGLEGTLVNLAENPLDVARLRVRSRRFMESHWNPSMMAERYERLYCDMLGRGDEYSGERFVGSNV